ncbi:MAG: Gfo/Idh/MocA family protein [Christensenellales bacterium]
MDRVRFGIIGCGKVTEVKSGPAFQKAPGASLEMVMRRDPVKLKDYAMRHGVPRYSTDYLDLLRDPDIDAIYVATPPDTHAFYTIAAAEYGKAVYVEKPMARSVAECRVMIAACREAGVPLHVAYYRRGQPKFMKARELLASGALGELRSFAYRYACPPPVLDPDRAWLMDRGQAGGGLLYDIGSHMLDMILFLLGEPLELVGRSANLSRQYDVPDTSSALLRFASGVQGAIQLSFAAAEGADELWISGSLGSLRLAIMSNEPLSLEKEGEVTRFPFPPLQHVQQPYIERVVRSLLGEEPLESSGRAALLTQEILETIDRSGVWHSPREGGTP